LTFLNIGIEPDTQRAIAVMEELRGVAIPKKVGEKLMIQSDSDCPFSDSVSEYPEICRLAERFCLNLRA